MSKEDDFQIFLKKYGLERFGPGRPLWKKAVDILLLAVLFYSVSWLMRQF